MLDVVGSWNLLNSVLDVGGLWNLLSSVLDVGGLWNLLNSVLDVGVDRIILSFRKPFLSFYIYLLLI